MQITTGAYLWVILGIAAILIDRWQNRDCPESMRRLPHVIKGVYVLTAPFTFALSLILLFSGRSNETDGESGPNLG